MASEHPDAATEKKIRDLETKKLTIHAQIAQLQADYLKLDQEMLAVGASSERIKLLLRW